MARRYGMRDDQWERLKDLPPGEKRKKGEEKRGRTPFLSPSSVLCPPSPRPRIFDRSVAFEQIQQYAQRAPFSLNLPFSKQNQIGCFRIIVHAGNVPGHAAQKQFNLIRGAVAAPDPDDFGRSAAQQAFFVKIRIFANQRKRALAGVLPHIIVIRAAHANTIHMLRFRKNIR